jgi:formyltetrahydrofolate deformylase
LRSPSVLPAFVGARPFAQASARGVKLIGATAHYASERLDTGPIIEQDVIRVDHRHDVAALRQMSRAIERAVLARAVGSHLADRVFVLDAKTIVFS